MLSNGVKHGEEFSPRALNDFLSTLQSHSCWTRAHLHGASHTDRSSNEGPVITHNFASAQSPFYNHRHQSETWQST